MSLSALPAWIPKRIIIDRDRFQADRLSVYPPIRRGSYRWLGPCEHRDAWIYVRSGWYWYARLELFLQALMHYCVIVVIRTGLVRAPYEGAWFHEFRFDPPDLWGSPIRRHDHYWQKPPRYTDVRIRFARHEFDGPEFCRVANW